MPNPPSPGSHPSPGPFTNRLIDESSPYLRQHAHNPVDWYPWGEEAFTAAKKANKPILLSIGYAACHWCHVMEHESFENEEIAQIMNDHFISIKVDREERPDLDQIYQNAVQLFIRRGGGWPLTMFLTHEKTPFYGGTYFPPNERFGLPGFPRILEMVAETYKEKSDDVAKTAASVQRAIGEMDKTRPASGEIPSDLLTSSVESLERHFDVTHGGFGSAPKFPSTGALSLFLRYASLNGDEKYRSMVAFTLGKMSWGGIYDQLGGGFHRYSTDEKWLVPHFEKMLYDNAQLASLYFTTYQATGQDSYRTLGKEILEYVIREMTDPHGGFYATQDADSEGHEGTFFVWTHEEVKAVIGETQADLFCKTYDVTPAGNFEGKNILQIKRPASSLAKETGQAEAEILNALQEGRKKLFARRESRIKPFRDEKILTSWNALMMNAFVAGYTVTRQGRYLSYAKRCAEFIMTYLYDNGRLLHTFKDGVGKLNGYLDDYTFLVDALLDLYEATATFQYLAWARILTDRLIEQFWDDAAGGFFYTSRDHESLIARLKPSSDQSIPSGNGMAAISLLRLFYLTGELHYFEKGEKTLSSFSQEMQDNIFGTTSLISAASFYLQKPIEIVVLGDLEERDALLAKIYQMYLPNKVIFQAEFNRMERVFLPPAVRGKSPRLGKTTVYLCHKQTCYPPMSDWNEIQEKLRQLSQSG